MKEDVFLYEIDGLKSKVKMRLRQEALHRKVFEELIYFFVRRVLLRRGPCLTVRPEKGRTVKQGGVERYSFLFPG